MGATVGGKSTPAPPSGIMNKVCGRRKQLQRAPDVSHRVRRTAEFVSSLKAAISMTVRAEALEPSGLCPSHSSFRYWLCNINSLVL